MSEPQRAILSSPTGDIHVDLKCVAHIRFIAPEETKPLGLIEVVERSGYWFLAPDTPENRKALIPVLVSNEAIVAGVRARGPVFDPLGIGPDAALKVRRVRGEGV